MSARHMLMNSDLMNTAWGGGGLVNVMEYAYEGSAPTKLTTIDVVGLGSLELEFALWDECISNDDELFCS